MIESISTGTAIVLGAGILGIVLILGKLRIRRIVRHKVMEEEAQARRMPTKPPVKLVAAPIATVAKTRKRTRKSARKPVARKRGPKKRTPVARKRKTTRVVRKRKPRSKR